MSLTKKLGICGIIVFSLYITPKGIKKCVEKYDDYEFKNFKKDKAFMKTFELADTDGNGFINPITELPRVKILSGAGPNCKRDINNLTLGEYEKYLSNMGYAWRHGSYRKVKQLNIEVENCQKIYKNNKGL